MYITIMAQLFINTITRRQASLTKLRVVAQFTIWNSYWGLTRGQRQCHYYGATVTTVNPDQNCLQCGMRQASRRLASARSKHSVRSKSTLPRDTSKESCATFRGRASRRKSVVSAVTSITKEKFKLIFPHLGLIAITFTYTLFCAALVYSIEMPFEEREKSSVLQSLTASENQILLDFWETSQELSKSAWLIHAKNVMTNRSILLFDAFDRRLLTVEEITSQSINRVWTLENAVFFSITTLTTIGYGNPVPRSPWGRVAVIVFSLLGIPLTIVTIANLGKFLSEFVVWQYSRVVICYHYVKFRYQQLAKKYFKKRHIYSQPICEECSARHHARTVLEEKQVPASVISLFLLSYTAIGAVLISYLEDWDYFESLYFALITATTVGFGDMSPKRDATLLPLLIYILGGLVITTMCVDVLGVQYLHKIHYFGQRIQDAGNILAFVGGKAVHLTDVMQLHLGDQTPFMLGGHCVKYTDTGLYIDDIFLPHCMIPYVPRGYPAMRYIDDCESLRSSCDSLGKKWAACQNCKTRMSKCFEDGTCLIDV